MDKCTNNVSIIRRWHKPKSRSPIVNSYNFNNNNIFMSKDSEEDPGEDIDVGDEKSGDDTGDDVRCNNCHLAFPNLQSFLKHREACSGSGQDSAAPGAGLQRASGAMI